MTALAKLARIEHRVVRSVAGRRARIPLESTKPIGSFAKVRVVIVVGSMLALAVAPIEHRGALLLVLAGALPWALAILLIAGRSPKVALHPAVAAGDLGILALGQLVAPEIYAGQRCLAICLFAGYAHFQGEQRGALLAIGGSALLIGTLGFTRAPLRGAALGFSETLFVAAAICSGVFVGRLRAAESTGRLRARDLSRRVIESEARVRRRVAIALHDGPVQLSVSLDITLEAARRALARGDTERAARALAEARGISEEVVGTLREELIGLGPYALEELTLDEALERCTPAWRRRFDLDVELLLDRLVLSDEVSGTFFGIAQEAVSNAGRHSGAKTIRISLRAVADEVELRITDDGHGFQAVSPLAPNEPGHIGLASMRERAELQQGTLSIESSETGSAVIVRLPLATTPVAGVG